MNVLGDFRTNENIAMASLHTQWYREHNRVRDILKKLRPKWPPDILFEETRRIIVAEYQHVIYNEFLPPLIGIHTNIKNIHIVPLLNEIRLIIIWLNICFIKTC